MNKLTSAVLMSGIPWENADLRYVAPFSGSDPLVYLRCGGEAHIVVGGMEAARARRLLQGRMRVWTPAELAEKNFVPRTLNDWCLFLLRRLKIRRVNVPADFPSGILRHIENAGVRADVAADKIFPRRQIKSAEEIKHIKACQQTASKSMLAAIALIRRASVGRRGILCDCDGVLTSERVRRVIHKVMLEHDCMGFGTIVACGAHAADPHETGHGALYAGRSIVLDIFPRHLENGYWGDLSRTVVKGVPSSELRRMYTAVRRAQALALAHIRAGVVARRIYDMVLRSFTDAGFVTDMSSGKMEGFIHSVGHGLGLDVHEEPRLGLGNNRLRAGQVLTVEPGLYYRHIGGVRIEDVVVVSADGCRILHRCPHVFQV